MNQHTHLSFIADAAQAESVRNAWQTSTTNNVVVCLDEGLFPPSEAQAILGINVKIVGLSELELSAEDIWEEAGRLADDLFPQTDRNFSGRVDRWLIESHRAWLLYAVYSTRLTCAIFRRYQPGQIWVPPYRSMRLTTRPDEDPTNPLFFDLLPALCRRARIKIHFLQPRRLTGLLRCLTPLKYVIGLCKVWCQRPHLRDDIQPRAVMFSNFENNLHRQFDLRNFGEAAQVMHAWVRSTETVVPVDLALARLGSPPTMKFGWFQGDAAPLAEISQTAGAIVHPLAGVSFIIQLFFHYIRQRHRWVKIRKKYNVPWLPLLFGWELPSVHAECRLAARFFAMAEYERASAVLRRWVPKLFVASTDHWGNLPLVAAAMDLGIRTLLTVSGISFYKVVMLELAADIICVYGREGAKQFKTECPNSLVLEAGDALKSSENSIARVGLGNPRRILFVTSARPLSTWWVASLLFDYRALREALTLCAEGLRRFAPPVRVLLKSHPVADLHDWYASLVDQFDDVISEHRKEPMSQQEMSEYDAAIIFSTATSTIAELARARVPQIFYSGAFTPFGRQLHDYSGLTVAESVVDILEQLRLLLSDHACDYRKETLLRADQFLSRYVNGEQRGFNSVLNELLCPPRNEFNS